ncbi:MAG: hypothetical protein M3483_07535 [Gemmatimonadota bacterium]|nr:hypothetical protein [Gemmatimonadota bacterium]
MNEAWNSEGPDDELREEYDFTPEQRRGAARGKYVHIQHAHGMRHA